MRHIINRWVTYLALFSIIAITGCANTPKLVLESTPSQPRVGDSQTTITSLTENWTKYNIYYSATSPVYAQGILFDPNDDDKMLVPTGDRWVKVADEETVRLLMRFTAGPMTYNGRLFRIISPTNQFFGYIYTSVYNNYAGLRVVDENTIAVLPVLEKMGR